MKNLIFQRVARIKDTKIKVGEFYTIPTFINGDKITHIRIYAGKFGFFNSDYKGDYITKKRARFFKVPAGAVGFKMKKFRLNVSGYFYGPIDFLFRGD